MGTQVFISKVLGAPLLRSVAACGSGQRGSAESISTSMQEQRKPNRLVSEKSPYLQQHAYNPVDWYPWGDEAFARARAEDKPIFLSIGYSTCHWCHVMEEESFENESIAEIMNEYFVNIKVDREERPDVDRVYMTALQAMGQNGGWPMSIFLTPDLKPFFGGTYFPPTTRYGRIGFADLLQRIHQIWTQDRSRALEAAEGVASFLKELATVLPAGKLRPELLDTCFRQLEKMYDEVHGGFSNAPKFPRPVVFDFLFRYYHRTDEVRALNMAEQTLREMACGGMYDHIGGGFHRYSVDSQWRVPHFEKMLYDQAQLVNAYLDCYVLTRDDYFAGVAREVLEYVLRDMRDTQGGFFSAEDADSPRPESPEEQGEGAFYVWTKKEITDILGEEAGRIFCFHYGIEEEGNVTSDPQLEFTGKNILYVARDLEETAATFQRPTSSVALLLKDARFRLLEARKQRPRPHRDDKILAGWNGLALSAFARAYQVMDESRYLKAAQDAAQFLLRTLYDPSAGRLHRRYRDGEAKLEAHLEDYAFVVAGLLDLYEADFDITWLERAVGLTEKQIEIFWDKEHGGFFETTGEDPSIIVRMKERYDGAEPSGNSVAAMNLLRLAHLTGNASFREKAEQTLEAFASVLEQQPVVMPSMASAYDFSTAKVKEIVIAGRKDHPHVQAVLRLVRGMCLPNKVVLLLEPSNRSRLARLAPFTAALDAATDSVKVFICEEHACRLPTSDVAAVEELLSAKR